MYICICNALKDKDFKQATSRCSSAECAEDLFELLGCKPQCGSCLCAVDEMLPLANQPGQPQPVTV